MKNEALVARAAKPQIPALTGLRFFLALWVVIFHQSASDAMVPADQIGFHIPALVCLIRTGYLAVGVFFALSGFVLAYNYSLEAEWPLRKMIDFGVARFARIYPTYALGLLLMAPIVLLNLWHIPQKGLVKQIGEAALHWTLLQAWIPTRALTWNMPGWSLSAEAFFYMCFPLAGVALWRITRKSDRVLPLLAGLWVLALAAPFLAIRMGIPGFSDVAATADNLRADPFWTALFKFNPLLQLPQFLSGILLVRLYKTIQSGDSRLKGNGSLLYIPGLCFELLVISRADSIAFPLFHNGLLMPLHGMVLLGLALGGGPLTAILSWPVLRLLGSASYAMYILQWPVFEWMTWFSLHYRQKPLLGSGEFTLYASVLILCSVLVHLWIEEPMNAVIKRYWSRRRSQAVVPPAMAPQPVRMK